MGFNFRNSYKKYRGPRNSYFTPDRRTKLVFYNNSHIFDEISAIVCFEKYLSALSRFSRYVRCDDGSAEAAQLTPPRTVYTLGSGDGLK